MRLKPLNFSPVNGMIDLKFLLAGNSTFTVSNDKGEHYTYRVQKSKNKLHCGKYTFFISLLTSPDTYTYMGVIKERGFIKLTNASKLCSTSKPFKVANWAINHIFCEVPEPKGYAIEHAGKCGRCGRELTTPESIRTGLGPVCREKAL